MIKIALDRLDSIEIVAGDKRITIYRTYADTLDIRGMDLETGKAIKVQ